VPDGRSSLRTVVFVDQDVRLFKPSMFLHFQDISCFNRLSCSFRDRLTKTLSRKEARRRERIRPGIDPSQVGTSRVAAGARWPKSGLPALVTLASEVPADARQYDVDWSDSRECDIGWVSYCDVNA